MPRNIKILAAIVVVLTLGSCKQEHKSIKLAHGLDTSHPVHKAMLFMADRLEEKSNGELTIQVYPSNQLGSERECVELLQIGSLGMTKVSAAVMSSFVSDYQVLSFPYIFRDKDHFFKVQDGKIGKDLLLESQDKWLRGLGFYDAGSRSFYTSKKAIRTPEDLKGQKIRVMQSPIAIKMVKAMGGSPTPMASGEIYTAVQQGVVDGAENNPPSYYFSRHYEVAKYYTIDEHASIPDVLLISTHIWESLNKQEQKWLQEAVDESVVYQRKLWAESEKQCLEDAKAQGVEIIYPDKAPFVKSVAPLYEELTKDARIKELVNNIKNVK
ncbi:MAG: TRAP transporter substrate-binding protein [Ichthyobacteriaceae bacterium]|nr:TRAP transporter substrate-binding protein [Ichthyobacteriaceae bacterium]